MNKDVACTNKTHVQHDLARRKLHWASLTMDTLAWRDLAGIPPSCQRCGAEDDAATGAPQESLAPTVCDWALKDKGNA